MKSSTTYKDYNTIQKIGSVLLIVASAIILINILNLFTLSHFIKNDLPAYIYLAGGVMILHPSIKKWMKKGTSSNNATLLIFFFALNLSVNAQDYSKQIAAFEQSFAEKSAASMNAYVSSTLKFDPIPVANTPAILNNIVTNLPKLNSMTILESEVGKAKIKYDFEGLGIRESSVHFDGEGKFTRIELIENLIKMEIEAQKKMKESVQLPSPGSLGDKYQPKKVEFKTADGLLVNGNLYEIGKDNPVILLCHQARYNRIEYADIAPKLNELGYNCLAIDQRSGGDFAGKPNETFERAKEKGFKTEYIDAEQDIESAVNFLKNKYNKKVIIWGSSYSSSLALFSSFQNKNVIASISFSPGDYFGDKKPSLKTVFSKIKKPFFVTSSKSEAEILTDLIGNKKLKENQIQYIPETEGFHGSKALWEGQKGAEEYWTALEKFLTSITKY